MAEEKNLAIKDGLDVFFSGQPIEPFLEPLNGSEDLIAKGLLDENMNPTSRGVLFTTLQDVGAIDMEGKLTEKGRAYAMPREASLQPENREAFKIRWNDEIDRPDSDFWSETVPAVAEFGWDAAAGLAKSAYYGLKPWGQNEDRAKQVIIGASAIENSIKATKELGAMGEMGAALVGQGLGAVIGMEKEADDTLWMARQDQARMQYEHQTAKTGKILEGLGMMAGAVETVAQAKASLPHDEAAALEKQGGAFGQFIDPTVLVPAGAAGKAGTAMSVTTRLALKAEKTLAKTIAMDAGIAAMKADAALANKAVVTATGRAAILRKAESTLASQFDEVGDQVLLQRSRRAGELAASLEKQAARGTSAIESLAPKLEQATATRAALATRIPEATAAAYQRSIQIGRTVNPVRAGAAAIGVTLEGLGKGLTAIDDKLGSFLKAKGWDEIYKGGLGMAGMVGLSTANPVMGGIGAAGAALKMGKVLSAAGKFSRVVGSEMMRARGQVPFWQRVANHAELSPINKTLAHTADFMTAGGAIPGAIRRTGRGVLAAYPIDLAFEALADGGDPNASTFKRAFAESLVIGGSSAALGGAFMGTKKRHRELAMGDVRNFMEDLTDPDQRMIYDQMPEGIRRGVATYAAANPNLEIRFSTDGPSGYDPASNVATVNANSINPLKGLIGHEVLHHVAIQNQIEGGIAGLLVGDVDGGTVGGLLRTKDGKLDPEFQTFVDQYNARMDAAGMKRPPMDTMAVEFFVESLADRYSSMAESGELGAMAGRTQARRWMGDLFEKIAPKLPIIRNLHFKLGGLMDQEGKEIVGSGLATRELPQTNKLFRDMVRASSGRTHGNFTPTGMDSGKRTGIPVTFDPANPVDVEMMHPLAQWDEKRGGVAVDASGKPVGLDRATEIAQGASWITIKNKLAEYKKAGKKPAKGEMHIDDEGNIVEGWMTNDTIKAIKENNKFNPIQIANLRAVNDAIKKGDGARFIMIYFPASKRKANGKVIYKPQEATLRDTAPVAIKVTKDDNILIGLMSVTQLEQNIQKRSNGKLGKKLYNGDQDAIKADVSAMMEAHKQGVDSLGYFIQKYGATEAERRKYFINTIFGLVNQTEQLARNPIFLEENVTSKDNVYRTYRHDRVSNAAPMSPNTHIPMPFNYHAVKMVLSPEVEHAPRYMPERNDAAYLAAVEAGDMETAQRMVDEAAKAAGYLPHAPFRDMHTAPSNWRASDEDVKADGADASLEQVRRGIHNQPDDYFHPILGPRYYSYGDKAGMESFRAITGKGKTMTVYRAVPISIVGTKIENRDWVSPSKSYAIQHGEARFGEGEYRIIKENIPANQLFWDGNDIREWGKDDDSSRYYKNTPNNIKSADPVTRDDQGNVIPLSQRFNSATPDIRYMPEPVESGGQLDIPQGASGKAIKTKLKHSKTPASFEASNATVHSPGIRYLPEPVWHGTPHKVDKFSTEKIGTGEGAQAYGWGLYFAGDQSVADHYKKVLGGTKSIIQDGKKYDTSKKLAKISKKYGEEFAGEADELLRMVASGESTLQSAASTAMSLATRSQAWRDIYISLFRGTTELVEQGNLYRVNLKVNDEDLLDWDKPLSEQSEKVRAAVDSFIHSRDTVKEREAAFAEYDEGAISKTELNKRMEEIPTLSIQQSDVGATVYQRLWNNQTTNGRDASQALAAAGIRGIRYLDGNSRSDKWILKAASGDVSVFTNRKDAEDMVRDFDMKGATIEPAPGTYNYVIFDENDIEILEENGKPVKP